MQMNQEVCVMCGKVIDTDIEQYETGESLGEYWCFDCAQAERKKLIEQDQCFVTFPPPDYSKMTNEQIRKRTQLLESAFKLAFEKEGCNDETGEIGR
jgi:hypothetical protein